jgi:hypothetical protein
LTPWQEHAEHLVVIACGGDGTVVWFLHSIVVFCSILGLDSECAR